MAFSIPSRAPRSPLVAPGQAELHLRDMTATFSADLSLAQADALLATHNQWLPVDGDPQRALSALVEHNSTGPLRLGFGGWRDLILGAQFHNGAGELISAGGKTVKNVAGYDLSKLMVGQHGCLGKLVTITTRTHRRPSGALIVEFPIQRLNPIGSLLTGALRPQWMLLTATTLRAGYLGDERHLNYCAQQAPGLSPASMDRCSLEEDANLRSRHWRFRGAAGSFVASIPPAQAQALHTALGAIDPSGPWAIDPVFGVATGLARDTAALENAVRRARGQVQFYDSAGQPVGRRVDPAIAGILNNLKQAFDPQGQLCPLPLNP